MDRIQIFRDIVGPKNLLTGDEMERFTTDWTGAYRSEPLAVARPANTEEVSALVRAAAAANIAIVPVGGNTGLCGGTQTNSALMISMERMNKIREIREDARIAIVEPGVVLSKLHDAVKEYDLAFPLTFGARGSAMIGGCLSTNAGGSNVLRYGNTRALCLGLEVVMPNGDVVDSMSALHKDNSGYDLKDLFIGAEGTLGLITGAVLKLVPAPAAYATAMIAPRNLPDALQLLNQLQKATGGAVEAFEYMPKGYMDRLLEKFPDIRAPFDESYDINILLEIGANAPRDVEPNEDGSLPIVNYLEEVLGEMLEEGSVLDAVVARSEAQRTEMWHRRESAAEVTTDRVPIVQCDVALPLDRVDSFLTRADAKVAELDPEAAPILVAHLGDGNVHYCVHPEIKTPEALDNIVEEIEGIVLDLGGSFSAEHGIGLSKRPTMARRKNKVAVAVMRQIKAALDPQNIMNPGKVLPD